MELKIICKRLITEDLNGRFTEGENAADAVGITVPRYYGEHDLSQFSFRMTAVSKDGSSAAEQLLAQDRCDEENIHLVWTVTSAFTARDGEIFLVLAGLGPGGEAVKFSSEPVTVANDGRVEFVPSPSLAEQIFNQVQAEAQKAADAAGRAEEAAESTALQPADENNLGGIISGGDVSVSGTGEVTVRSVNGKTVGASVPENAVFTDTVYTLPKATAETLGGVKVDGNTVSIDENGVISAAEKYILPSASAVSLGGVKSGGDIYVASNGSVTVTSVGGKTVGKSVPDNAEFTDTVYTLPPATDSVLGGVKVDGYTITSDSSGVISVVGSQNPDGEIVFPTASEKTLGAVKVDGTTITSDADGVISAIAYELPAATSEALGGVRSGGDVSVSEAGEVTVNSVNGKTVDASVPENAVFTDTVYVLPAATDAALGGVKVDGDTIKINEDGVISAAEQYVLPAATSEALGGVRSGGDVSVSEAGEVTVNSVNGKTVDSSVPENAVFTDTVYTLPAATSEALGGVMSGGDISVSETGGVSVNSVGGKTLGTSVPSDAVFTDTVYTLPVATTGAIGGVKSGGSITVGSGGVVTVNNVNGYSVSKSVPSTAKFTDTVSTKHSLLSATKTSSKITNYNLKDDMTKYRYIIIELYDVSSDDKYVAYTGSIVCRTEMITGNYSKYFRFPIISPSTGEVMSVFAIFSSKTQVQISAGVSNIAIWGANDLLNIV